MYRFFIIIYSLIRFVDLLDITAVCILEAFSNPSSLEMAEKVLTHTATLKAKEAFAVNRFALRNTQINVANVHVQYTIYSVFRWLFLMYNVYDFCLSDSHSVLSI